MTATAVQQLLDQANRKGNSPSAAVRADGLAALRRVERFLDSGEPFEIELRCAECWRPRRAWFATGVADDGLHSLCCRVCVASWKASHQGARVLKRDGRDYVDQPAAARRAA